MPIISQINKIQALYVLKFVAWIAFSSASLRNQIEIDSLMYFVNGISSPSPLNWSVSVDCCLWEGVVCNKDHRVSRLWLPSRQLQGKISPAIANLSYLSQLNLSNNQLLGPLPDMLFKSLNYLQIIDLSYNSLSQWLSVSDKLPSTIRSVDISSNKFNGEIQFAFLEGSRFLVSLNVSNNSFTGLAPAFICTTSPFLKFLDVVQLLGPLPDDIYNISTLSDLSLAANRISGLLDHRVANLLELRILSLYGNQLAGIIPENIGRLYKLENLLLHINQLNGTIPMSLTNCSSLKILNLRVNNLGGELSAFNFSSLVRLRTIDLGDNFFTGSLPATLFSCKKLVNIRFSNNSLQGEILPDIQALESLSFISFSRNNFTNIMQAIKILMGCRKLGALILSKNFYGESLPNSNGTTSGDDGFKELRILGIGGCGFRGEGLPRWLRNLGKLQVLDISYNQIQGLIPGWISELPNLFYLDVSYNLLSGSLPPELFRLQRLTADNNISLHLDQIYLELPIFVSPNNVSMYQYNLPGALYLDGNNLSGNLSTGIGPRVRIDSIPTKLYN